MSRLYRARVATRAAFWRWIVLWLIVAAVIAGCEALPW